MQKSAAYLLGLQQGLGVDLDMEKMAQVVDILDYLETASPHQKQAAIRMLKNSPQWLKALLRTDLRPAIQRVKRFPLFFAGKGPRWPQIHWREPGVLGSRGTPRPYTTLEAEQWLRRGRQRPRGALQNWLAKMRE